MSFFLVGQFESKHQAIFLHINADDFLCNQAAILSVCVAGRWFAALGSKMFLHGSDDNRFDVGRGNARDRTYRCRLGLSFEVWQRGVITIADSGFASVCWDHAVASVVV